jgi:hypothetical protein
MFFLSISNWCAKQINRLFTAQSLWNVLKVLVLVLFGDAYSARVVGAGANN